MCVTLEVTLPISYPECEPIVRLRNPRGLDDSTVDHILAALKEKCSEYLGQPVIFELIEVIDLINTITLEIDNDIFVIVN